jgi:hypothetical protein
MSRRESDAAQQSGTVTNAGRRATPAKRGGGPHRSRQAEIKQLEAALEPLQAQLKELKRANYLMRHREQTLSLVRALALIAFCLTTRDAPHIAHHVG